MPPAASFHLGNLVKAKAIHVTNLKECQRRFGAEAKTEMVHGVIIDIIWQQNQATGKVTINICCDFDFGDGVIKRKSLGTRLLQHVTTVPPPPPNDTMLPTAMEVDVAPPVTEGITVNNNNTDNNEDNNDATIDLNMSESTDTEEEEAAINNESTVAAPNQPEQPSPIQPRVVQFKAATASPSGRPLRNSTMVADTNGTLWYHEPTLLLHEINGLVRYHEWGIRTPVGDVLYPGSNTDERYSRLDIFLMMFPPRQLDHMLKATNDQLTLSNKRTTTKQELLKFFGIIILTTKYEFTSCSSLWSTVAPSKYEQPACFGRTGMGRVRFDELWTSVRFSYQPPTRPEDVSSEAYR
jgi:hypothetical protein